MEHHFIERQLPQAPNTMSSSPLFMMEINIIFWHLLIKVYHLWTRHTRQQKNKINKAILKHGKSYSSILLVSMRVLLILRIHSCYPMHKCCITSTSSFIKAKETMITYIQEIFIIIIF